MDNILLKSVYYLRHHKTVCEVSIQCISIFLAWKNSTKATGRWHCNKQSKNFIQIIYEISSIIVGYYINHSNIFILRRMIRQLRKWWCFTPTTDTIIDENISAGCSTLYVLAIEKIQMNIWWNSSWPNCLILRMVISYPYSTANDFGSHRYREDLSESIESTSMHLHIYWGMNQVINQQMFHGLHGKTFENFRDVYLHSS